MSSETSRCRHLLQGYTRGNGVDLASGGDPVVPWAIQIDLPEQEFLEYGHAHPVTHPIQLRGLNYHLNLPFKDGTMDWLLCSHLIEDYVEWWPMLVEWARVIKPGGHIIILLPDLERFNEAIKKGGGGNANHKHESYPGELTEYFDRMAGFKVVRDSFTDNYEGDYNILFIAQKLC